MKTLQLISAGIWAFFTLAFVMLTIAEFRIFYLLMAMGCCGISTVSFLMYRWGDNYNDRSW